MEAISVIKLFNTSKASVEDFASRVISNVEAGMINPLELKLYLKAMEQVIEKIDTSIKIMARNEADKYPEKTFTYQGATIEKAELGTKYVFSECNDSQYNSLKSQVDELNVKIKERETFLKSITECVDIHVGDGVVETIYPAKKTSTSGLKITIK